MSVGECCGSSNNECEAGLIDGPYAAAGRGEVLRGFYCYYLAHELRRRYLEYPIKSARVARFSREVAQHQGKAHLQSQGARGASDRGGGGGLVAGITDLAARDQLQRASSFFGRQL